MPDIRSTGALNWRALQQANAEKFNPETATNEDWMREAVRVGKSKNTFTPAASEGIGIQAAQAGYGDSQYDEAVATQSQLENLGEVRYNEQPWYDVLANGVGKMFGKAGTTFVSSLVGLPYGLFQVGKGLVEGQDNALANIWDNDVTQALSNVDKWMEENMTNYQSQAQQEDPHFRFGDMNWWADNVITNAGFTLGAAASMAVGSGSLGLMSKALGFVNDVSKTTKGGAALLSSLFSATGEGMIEAKQGVEERNKLEMQRLNDAFVPKYSALSEQKQQIDAEYALTGDYDAYKARMGDYLAQKQEIDSRKAAGEQQIIESGQRMGNAILGLNQALLTAGNLIQFGKGMVKSFDSARHAAEVSSKAAKPFGVSATLRKTAEHSGYEIQGKGLGRAVAATKGIVTEGSEEMNQQWVQSGAGAYYNEKDVNDYWKAKLDPEAYKDTAEGLHTLGSAISQGFKESWGDPDQWEQFVIGGLTGAMGSYSPTKLFNQDKTKAVWDPRRYGSWEGGAVNGIRDFNREYNQYQENIDELNKILQSEDFPARVRSMAGHTYTQGEKDAAVEEDDKKAFKDAEDKQTIHDIQAFLRAGKLDDLRAIYNEIGSDLSDEDVQNIIKSTTKEITAEEDKQNFNRQADEQIFEQQRQLTAIDDEIAKITEDAQLLMEEDARKNYLETVAPQITELRSQQEEHNQTLAQLTEQKNALDEDTNSQIAEHQQNIAQLEQEKKEWQEKKNDSELLEEEEKQPYLNSINEQVSAISGQIRQEKQAIATLKNEHKKQSKEIDTKAAVVQQQADNLGNQIAAIEDAPINAADYASSSVYLEAAKPKIEELQQQRAEVEQTIAGLEQQKEQYVPKKYYEGAYVDREGNFIASDDEIRDIVKHNSEELNRKLDSYLESIDYVNRRTRGALTKDQEDNLAYLHNLGKESDFRMRKIMADVRQQLPKTFLLKTSKTPEQLTKENASSDLVFTKDDNTKEGYVEVDTGLMNNDAFADFFQREVMRGGNIRPEFAETADEKAAREEEEKNLPEAERKKKARERASKKWQNAIQQMQDDANEQWDTNWRNLVDNFIDNYKRSNNATLDETVEAFSKVKQDLQDASNLFDQAGEYQRTLVEYMQNPSKVDKDKAKAESEAQKAAEEQRAKNAFEGKDAKQMKQELAEGVMDEDEFFNFANMDISGDAPAPLAEAQQQAKKAQEGNQKASALKQHIQEQLGDSPTQQELNAAQVAMQMVDAANMATDNPEDLNISTPELNQVPLDAVDPNASIEDVDALNMEVQQMLADAFNAFEEDRNAQDDIPEVAPAGALNDVEAPETGHDATTKTKPEVVAPVISSPSEAAQNPIPKNPLTEGAITDIIKATSDIVTPARNTTGTWRSTTTRHPYGKSTGTYHETLTDKNSIQYKRSKAIWEYLNNEGAFDRQDNASADRIKEGDVVHFMVKFFPEVAGEDPRAMTAENQRASLVIFMLNDNGEVVGDLPLADFEPSYRAGNPTQQVKDLMSLQNKLFDAYMHNYSLNHDNEAIADSTLIMDGRANLNLTFDGSKKPLLSKVKQVMKGVVPYKFEEINTLNEVANGQPFELGVAVTGTTIAKKRGDKTQHKEIVKPHVGTTGQPYLLLPTPSGEQIAVPFYMKPFDANQHRNTEMYKLLTNAIYNILTNNTNKEVFKKNMDVIEGLLQVKVADGVKNAIDVRKDSVTMHLQSLTDANNKIETTVPFNQNTSELAMSIVNQLSGIPINVSLQFLNDSIEAGGRKANYNNVIGEIADVNLPKATNHTVNGWFTVELAPSAGIKPSKKVTPKTTGVISENIGGKSIEINTDTLVAYNPATGEVITDNEEVNLRLAQIKAAKPQYQGKDRIQVSINGELRTYDTKENKFVKNATIKKETTATPQPAAEETPNVSDVTPPTSGAVSFAEPQTPTQPQTQSKTIEQIENEMKQKKIVGRQTKDAWDAIPNDLKLKMVNDGQPITLAFNEKKMVVSLSDREGLIQALTQANMAAKAGNMKVSEAPKYRKVDNREQKRTNIQREKRWLQKNLPMFSSEERLKLIQGLIEIPGAEGWAWGRFQSGVITLSDMAAAGTTYHEAFHAVTQTLLDDEELDTLYEAAKERYKEDDVALIEELLAEDFRRYVQSEETPIIGYIRKVFRRILNAMRGLNSYRDPINLLFYKINNGEFKDTLPRVSRGNNAFYSKYIDGVNEDLLHYKSDLAKTVIKSFRDNKSLVNENKFDAGNAWTPFKNSWARKGVVLKGKWRKRSTGGIGRYALNDILVLEEGVERSLDYYEDYLDFMQERAQQHAAKQAREGRLEMFKWEGLAKKQQDNLMLSGMSQKQYENLSLEEKEQWVKCRA